MAITIRIPKVVALDGFAVQTVVPVNARITSVPLGGGKEMFDIHDAAGAPLALLGAVDLPQLMSRAPISQPADDWLVLRVAAIDEDATPAGIDFDIGAILDDAGAGATYHPLSTANGVILGPIATAAIAQDNMMVYKGQRLLFGENAVGGPWDIMLTLMPLPTVGAGLPTGKIVGAAPV